jgi:Zn-dependent M16 (insulinase) family peptidase
VLATETFDDKGLPHTLEQLTFMGSKTHPYRGALHLLASRAGADALSAWTAIDHTAYTISSAGAEGFLNMLPVYLEHILYPTLTDEGFLSEIYHVDGHGEEGGVVFSEMQGIEQTSERVLMRYANRKTNPPGSGYQSVTGGLLKDIRQLTIEQIRDFHEQYYQPWNPCLHVDGNVPLVQLLKVLYEMIDPMIVKHAGGRNKARTLESWQRHWVEPIRSTGPVIKKDVKDITRFISDNETFGAAMLVWKGPAIKDHMVKTVSNDYAAAQRSVT